MMDFTKDLPFPLAVTVLFVVVLLRASATYWLGRAAYAGAGRTRAHQALASRRFQTAQSWIGRWGAPVITLSFLTIGFQTAVNLAAGVIRMPLRRYLPAMAVGCVLWAVLYATVGFVTIEALGRLYELSPVTAKVLLVLLILGLSGFIALQIRNSKEEKA
jgi:membrane protein DedA with SNARE-associated domain